MLKLNIQTAVLYTHKMEARLAERFGMEISHLRDELVLAKKENDALKVSNETLQKEVTALTNALKIINVEDVEALKASNEKLQAQLVSAEEKIFDLMLEKVTKPAEPVKPIKSNDISAKVELTVIIPVKSHEPRMDTVPLELHAAFVSSPRNKVTKKQVVEVLHRALGHVPLGVKPALGRELINNLFPAYYEELKKSFPGVTMSREKIQGIALRY